MMKFELNTNPFSIEPQSVQQWLKELIFLKEDM